MRLDLIILGEDGFKRNKDKKQVEILGGKASLSLELVKGYDNPLSEKIMKNFDQEIISNFNGYMLHYTGSKFSRVGEIKTYIFSLIKYKEK